MKEKGCTSHLYDYKQYLKLKSLTNNVLLFFPLVKGFLEVVICLEPLKLATLLPV